MFDVRGYFAIDKQELAEDAFMELALGVDAEDISTEEEAYEIFSSPESYVATKEALEKREIPLLVSELARIPQTYLELDTQKVETNLKLLEVLEEHDDVQNVWSNINLDTQALAAHSD
jgi:transcriptional/translational regulatory protein YebC/TACO1